VSAQYRLWRMGLARPRIFSAAPDLRLPRSATLAVAAE
jgi:hypothetical protein